MLKWLSSWFRPKTEPRVGTIICTVCGQVKTMAIVGAVGTRLQVTDDTTTMLIGAGQCADQEEFGKALRQWNPALSRARWADGSPFDPEKGDRL